ncbi:hypothetical protein SK128_011264 [Halocaridina rubra]|uniref:Uncharacterized protein n=1 Tax=Halocaridina rubra TaxID=373956 RepID=A0AAN8XRJ9_HALRR
MSANLNSEIRASQKGRSRFYLARQTFFPQGYGIACRGGAPYLQKFDDVLVQLLQAGLINKWVKDEVLKLPSARGGQGKRRKTSDAQPLSLNHLQAAFYLLFGGCVLSAVALVMEHVKSFFCSSED